MKTRNTIFAVTREARVIGFWPLPFFFLRVKTYVKLAFSKCYTFLHTRLQDFSSKGRNICILIYIFHIISIAIEKVKNKVMVNMLIRKENLYENFYDYMKKELS